MPHDVHVARLGHAVAAGFPHHATQRGNRRQIFFFEPADLPEGWRASSAKPVPWSYRDSPAVVRLVSWRWPAGCGGMAAGWVVGGRKSDRVLLNLGFAAVCANRRAEQALAALAGTT